MEKSEFEELVISTRQAVLFKHERAVVDAAMATVAVIRRQRERCECGSEPCQHVSSDDDLLDALEAQVTACRAYEEVKHE